MQLWLNWAKMIVENIGVIGAGQMGSQIAALSAMAGIDTNLFDDVHRELIGGARMGRQVIMRMTTSF